MSATTLKDLIVVEARADAFEEAYRNLLQQHYLNNDFNHIESRTKAEIRIEEIKKMCDTGS